MNLYKANRYGVDIKVNYRKGEAVILGPIAIDPEYQKQGYGSKLIRHTLKVAKDNGVPFVLVVGDENYYSRFGFESASKYNLFLEGTDTSAENPFFMIRIFENTFNDEEYDKGIFYNPEVFNVSEEEVDEFDERFEYKEKRVQEGQLEIN